MQQLAHGATHHVLYSFLIAAAVSTPVSHSLSGRCVMLCYRAHDEMLPAISLQHCSVHARHSTALLQHVKCAEFEGL